jgi:hypothetical protein
MSFLAPIFFAGLAALAIPVLVHLIQRERKEVVEFPSLMFIRKIPYQSVERRRIHNWLLLALRAAAMALVIAAFTRPFFRVDPLRAERLTGAREVVILLDRSASMGYGDRWKRAQDEARKVVNGLRGSDRATLVLFGVRPEEAVRSTDSKSQLETGIAAAKVSSEATAFGPALRFAQSLLTRSELPQKEAVLISDFQKGGWARQEEIKLPEGATLTPISLADTDTADLSIASVTFQRTTFEGQERVGVTAGLTNRGKTPVQSLPVKLEIDGRVVDTRPVTIGPNESGSVTFQTFTVSEASMRGVVRAGTDSLAANNNFFFALSPSRPVSVLLVQAEGEPTSGEKSPSFYLATALGVNSSPPFKVDVVPVSRVNAGTLERRSAVVLNNAGPIPAQTDPLLKRFVEQGGGMFVALGENSPWTGGDPPLLTGRLGGPVERRGGLATIGWLDYSHPIFEIYKDPRNGTLGTTRYPRYRQVTPVTSDHVLAKFDDGAVALVERKVGSGRVMTFAHPLDASWSSFPTDGLYPVVLPDAIKYVAQYEQPDAWHIVGRRLDISVPMAALVREGQAGTGHIDAPGATARKATGVVMSPSGAQTTLGEGGTPSIELAEQGLYSVRMQGITDKRPYSVAVNIDPVESDLTPVAPQELVAMATGTAGATASGGSLERPDLTPADVEKKQTVWWFLLFAGALAVFSEGSLANRLSRKLRRT